MSRFTSEEEIAIIDEAVTTIENLQTSLKDAVQRLTPLADENLSLRDVIRKLEEDDAAGDAALVRLRDRLNGPDPVEPSTPVTPEVPETPVTPGTPVIPEVPETPAVPAETPSGS